jgi:glycosyltransferase involved in cell wall biosynthesis
VWSRLHERFGDWRLVITGPDEMGHVQELRAASSRLGCASKVTFTGQAYGEEKMDLLGACDLLVLPSLSENFGMSVAEALAAGKPVITTVTTPWEGVRQRQCGWWIDLGAAPLEAALAEAMAADERMLAEMGLRGRQLVEETCSLGHVARQRLDMYAWLLGRGDRPDFVYLDTENARER